MEKFPLALAMVASLSARSGAEHFRHGHADCGSSCYRQDCGALGHSLLGRPALETAVTVDSQKTCSCQLWVEGKGIDNENHLGCAGHQHICLCFYIARHHHTSACLPKHSSLEHWDQADQSRMSHTSYQHSLTSRLQSPCVHLPTGTAWQMEVAWIPCCVRLPTDAARATALTGMPWAASGSGGYGCGRPHHGRGGAGARGTPPLVRIGKALTARAKCQTGDRAPARRWESPRRTPQGDGPEEEEEAWTRRSRQRHGRGPGDLVGGRRMGVAGGRASRRRRSTRVDWARSTRDTANSDGRRWSRRRDRPGEPRRARAASAERSEVVERHRLDRAPGSDTWSPN